MEILALQSIKTAVALIQSCITLCSMETIHIRYRKEVSKIAVRLADILSQKTKWKDLFQSEDGSSNLTSRRFHEVLKDVYKVLQAATSPTENWRHMLKELFSAKDLTEELLNINNELNGIMIQLALQQSIITDQRVVLMIKAFLAKVGITNSKRKKQQEIDDALENCYTEPSESVDSTEPASFLTLSDTLNYEVFAIENRDDIVYQETVGCSLGRGAFAEVFKGHWRRYNKNVAVKVVRSHVDVENACRKQLIQELRLMSECHIHPNVVELLGYYAPIGLQTYPLIIMELMDDSLFVLLHGSDGSDEKLPYPFQYADLLNLLKGIASAIQFLHLQGIVHRDIKTSNILVNRNQMIAKLADFGIAVERGVDTTMMTEYGIVTPGTPFYQAPEILKKQVKSVSRMAEMYSFGVTIWECISRKKPKLEMADNVSTTSRSKAFPVKEFGNNIQIYDPQEQDVFQRLEKISYLCLLTEPQKRPKATAVVSYLNDNRPFNKEDFQFSQLSNWDENHTRQKPCCPPLIQSNSNVVVRWCGMLLALFLIVLVVIVVLYWVLVLDTPDPPSDPQPSLLPVASPSTLLPSPSPHDIISSSPSPLGIDKSPPPSPSPIDTPDPPSPFASPTTLLPSPSPLDIISSSPSPLGIDVSPPPSPSPTKSTYCFETTDDLRQAVTTYFEGDVSGTMQSTYGSIGSWCVGQITDFSYLFNGFDFGDGTYFNSAATTFNEDISQWDVSSATTMRLMFRHAQSFNQDVSGWDISSVTNIHGMFSYASAFNANVGLWNTSSVQFMSGVFFEATSFNQDLSGWDVTSVTETYSMFKGATLFNQDLCPWESLLQIAVNMSDMFSGATSCESTVDPTNINCATRGPFCHLCTPACFSSTNELREAVTTYFEGDVFGTVQSTYGSIGSWSVGQITDFSYLFNGFDFGDGTYYNPAASTFNEDISQWDVSSGTNMEFMFYNAASFNQNLDTWDVSRVTSMKAMFKFASSFSGNLASWSVGSVTDTRSMFVHATAFNSDVSSWDISKVTIMEYMFDNAVRFDQNLCQWGNIIQSTAIVQFIFSGATSCPSMSDPDLTIIPRGPFCYVC